MNQMKRIMVTATLIFTILTSLAVAQATHGVIFPGKSFREALEDIVMYGATAMSHEWAKASSKERTDVFELRGSRESSDGRVLILHSVSPNLGEPYKVKTISIIPPASNAKPEVVSSLKLLRNFKPSSSPGCGFYSGEPLAEALYDIVQSGAIPISHELAKASSRERTDVFKLHDGRVLILHSNSRKLKEPFTLQKVSTISSNEQKRPETHSSFRLLFPGKENEDAAKWLNSKDL